MGRGKGNKTRNAHQKAHDHKQESALRLEGKSFRAIAEELGISRETVRKDLVFLDKGLNEAAVEDVELLKKQIAAKFRFAQVESLIAWRHSQQPGVKQVTKVTADGDEVTTTVDGRSGHAAHMANYTAAVDKEARLFDLYKPEKGGAVELNELEQALAEELEKARQQHGPS